MLNKTVEAGAGVCLALGKVERVSEVYGRSYTHQVAVELPGGTERAEFALSSDDVINYRLEGGDPVLVTFHPQGQYAIVQGLQDVAKSLGLGPVEASAEDDKLSVALFAALKHADEVSKLYGLNVRGNTIALLEQAVSMECDEDAREEMELFELWDEYQEDVIREDEQGSVGHMSDSEISILTAESKDLIDMVLHEKGLDTIEQVKEALTK